MQINENCYVLPIGIAVEELHLHIRPLMRIVVYRVKYMSLRYHSSARNSCIGQSFGTGYDIRGNINLFCSKGCTKATESGDYFIKYEQNAMLRTDIADTV